MSDAVDWLKTKLFNQSGFCADPSLPLWLNVRNYVYLRDPATYFSQITNKKCHNLCDPPSAIPRGVESLLGLGLKYCIRYPRPKRTRLRDTMARLRRDVRRIYAFKYRPPPQDPRKNYIPELYYKSDWDPPECDEHQEVEEALDNFESAMRDHQSKFNAPSLSNLNYIQWRQCETLKCNNEFISVEADKNLGGCCLYRDTYGVHGVDEHLGDNTVYQKLTKAQALELQDDLRYQFERFYTKWFDRQAIFLRRSLEYNPDQFARFRMSVKAHKTPWKMRPIVCCSGTFMNDLSRWLDYWLQKLKPYVPSYIRDSHDFLAKLKKLGRLPPNAKLFTADTKSMYTNIDTDHAIDVISTWLDSLELPDGFPLDAVKEAMKLVMRNNVFEWGDCYFLQLLGIAMGTSAACMWATIYFAVHELDCLLPTYGYHLLPPYARGLLTSHTQQLLF